MDDRLAAGAGEVSALARGLDVLRVVGMAAAPLSHRELADATGIPKPTVTRLVATLLSTGFLRQSPAGERYSLGPAMLDLSQRYLLHFDLRTAARRHLVELAEWAEASVHMGVQAELDILVIDSIRPRSALITSRIEVGARLALATSAAGRAWLSCLDDDARRALLARLRRAGGKGWAALERRLLASMDEHRRLGYCTSFGEWHPQIHAIGFAIGGPQGERYAFSCGGPAYLMPEDVMRSKIAPKVVETIERIRHEMGQGHV